MLVARELLRLRAVVEEARDLAQLISQAARNDVRESVSSCAEKLDEAMDCIDKARRLPEIQQLIEAYVTEEREEVRAHGTKHTE